MFLHINTFGQQLSVHSKDAVVAVPEEKDTNGNITVTAVAAKPAEPLRNAVRKVLDHWKRTETDIVALANGKRLDPNKTAVENGLKENDFIQVVSQKELDEDWEEKKRIANEAGKLAGH